MGKPDQDEDLAPPLMHSLPNVRTRTSSVVQHSHRTYYRCVEQDFKSLRSSHAQFSECFRGGSLRNDETDVAILKNKVEFDINCQHDVTAFISLLNFDILARRKGHYE